MYIGIESQTGLIYEGVSFPKFPVVPAPIVLQAKLIEVEGDWHQLPDGLSRSALAWIFREDSFDPVTRTRRGRLYFSVPGQTQPASHYVLPNPHEEQFWNQASFTARQPKLLHTYGPCYELLNHPRRGQGCTLALGGQRAASIWRVVQTEFTITECVSVVLKAMTAFGLVPELDLNKIDSEFRPAVSQAMERVLDSAFRESPISVIDHCRNALAVLGSRWLVQEKGHDRSVLTCDLGRIATILQGDVYKMNCAAHLASLVARLHARGKSNEQVRHGTQPPVDEDAALAIEALGFVLREIRWAK